MFKLLSKESNIFSIPVYLVFLLAIVIFFNFFDSGSSNIVFYFNTLHTISAFITFAGIALGYFLFHQIDLTHHSHLPLFLYTFMVFALYPGYLDIGISVSLLTNSILLLILSHQDNSMKNSHYLLSGSLLAVNYIFLPTTFPLIFFVILHIIGTSDRILQNIVRLFFGMLIVVLSYFSIAYFLHWNHWNTDYIPIVEFRLMRTFYPMYFLLPVMLMLVYAVFDHFANFNKKSPASRFKYTFLLIFSLSQLVTLFLYMGKNYEYLLLMAFPATVILSRMLRFLPKYWMRELFLWIIILSLILFKIGIYIDFIP
ncbi:MAG: DUF6427 family protein [Bergeyella sp.]